MNRDIAQRVLAASEGVVEIFAVHVRLVRSGVSICQPICRYLGHEIFLGRLGHPNSCYVVVGLSASLLAPLFDHSQHLVLDKVLKFSRSYKKKL